MPSLSDLPRLIDDAITGIVSFGYGIASALLASSFRPVRGTLRLARVSRAAVNSRTALFVASAAFAASGGGNLSLPLRVASGADFNEVGTYILNVALCFVLGDGVAHLVSKYSAARGRRRRRAVEMLRYSLAATTANLALLSLLFAAAEEEQPSVIGRNPGDPWTLDQYFYLHKDQFIVLMCLASLLPAIFTTIALVKKPH